LWSDATGCQPSGVQAVKLAENAAVTGTWLGSNLWPAGPPFAWIDRHTPIKAVVVPR
jgi:hypothetical protein